MDPLALSSLSNEDLPFLGVVARRGVSQLTSCYPSIIICSLLFRHIISSYYFVILSRHIISSYYFVTLFRHIICHIISSYYLSYCFVILFRHIICYIIFHLNNYNDIFHNFPPSASTHRQDGVLAGMPVLRGG